MKTLMGTLFWIAVAMGLLLAAIFLAQDRLIYFPARAGVGQLAATGAGAWPSPEDFRGLVVEPAGAVRGTALVFHGNAGHAGDRSYYAAALVPLGWRVILAEYPGYGPRSGAVGEASLVSDAEATIVQAHRQYGAPLLVVGESLGAGVAAAAAAQQRERVDGLLLITPWDRLASVAGHHYPWLPLRWMLRDEYDSARHLASFDRPVEVAVAERDSIVPARFGIALHAALRGPKRLVVIPASGHNDWPERVNAAWWRDAVAFLLREDSQGR